MGAMAEERWVIWEGGTERVRKLRSGLGCFRGRNGGRIE